MLRESFSPPPPPMGDKPRAELFSSLAHLYRTRDYSDLVIFAKDGSRHPVHRCIVCPRSHYLRDAVQQGQWRDGNEGHLALDDEEPEVVRLLVEYLYLLDYGPISSSSSSDEGPPSSSHTDYSDTMSVRTEAGQYGHVYGTSAISAFGGPVSSGLHHAHHNLLHSSNGPQSPPLSTLFASSRPRADSSLTVHAMPTGGGGNSSATDFAVPDLHHHHPHLGAGDGRGGSRAVMPRRRQTTRGVMVTSAPEVSPLATAAPHLVLHARVYAAAARFGVEGLRALALDKFKIQLTRHWDSTEFPEAVHIVYHCTPAADKEMREAVADTLEWHNRLLDKPEVEVAIMDINGLAYELLKRSRRTEPEYMD